jgi:chloride channel protein, CIC family
MSGLEVERGATTEGVPVAPSLASSIEAARVPVDRAVVDKRVVILCGWAILLALLTGAIAQALMRIIYCVTNLAFYGRPSFAFVSPAGNHLGWKVLFIPVIGGVIVGYMARYGSKAIRGHGIPEAM